MKFPSIYELKDLLNLTEEEVEFDRQLIIILDSAKNRVLSYLKRPVYEEMPSEPEDCAILVDSSIKSAILHVAEYVFENKGVLDKEMIVNIMDSLVEDKRLHGGPI